MGVRPPWVQSLESWPVAGGAPPNGAALGSSYDPRLMGLELYAIGRDPLDRCARPPRVHAAGPRTRARRARSSLASAPSATHQPSPRMIVPPHTSLPLASPLS